MSYLKIWIHCVWTTKERISYLTDPVRELALLHIRENAKQKGIYIDHINSSVDHLHALISLGSTQTISEIMQKLKGESSFWINKSKLTRLKFQWQDDYYAVSIGTDQLESLRKYIRNQVEHHRKVPLEEELNKMVEEYKMERFLD
jgi:REP element-mobilizing transposase RayT